MCLRGVLARMHHLQWGLKRFMCKQMLSRRCLLSHIPLRELAVTLFVCICAAIIGDITRDGRHKWLWYTLASNTSIERFNRKSCLSVCGLIGRSCKGNSTMRCDCCSCASQRIIGLGRHLCGCRHRAFYNTFRVAIEVRIRIIGLWDCEKVVNSVDCQFAACEHLGTESQ